MTLGQSPNSTNNGSGDAPSAAGDYCPSCRPLRACQRSDPLEIHAHNNAPGEGIAYYVDLPPLDPAILRSNLNYFAMNDDSNAEVQRLKRNIATLEQVEPATVRITGSLLDLFRILPGWVDARTVFRLAGDFPGYTNFVHDRETREIAHDLSADAVDPATVAAALAGVEQPLLYLTFPITNPNQQTVSLDVATAALDANPRAIVVIDQAYRRYRDTPGAARFAQTHDRVLYVDTAAKDLLLCGARVGWLTTSPALLARIDAGLAPYVVSPVSAEQVNSFLEAPEILARMVETVAKARDILTDGILQLGFLARVGAGPWVLVYLGDYAGGLERQLLLDHHIRVQVQGGTLGGWVRISATVPCEARRIVRAIEKIAVQGRAGPIPGHA